MMRSVRDVITRSIATLVMGGLAFVSACGMTAAPVAASSLNPKECPTPVPEGVLVPLEVQERAWKRALEIAEVEGARGTWTRSLWVVWVNKRVETYGWTIERKLFRDWYDIHHAEYKSFEWWDENKGDKIICEYVLLFVPRGTDEGVMEGILVHEYLHAVWVRLMAIGPPEFFMRWNNPKNWSDGGEEWVRRVYPWKPQR